MKPAELSGLIKSLATKHGASFCGISKAGFLEEEAPRLERWLKAGMHGEMAYMENHFDKRLDPTKLVEGSKSVVSFLFNYYPKEDLATEGQPKIAKYAYGQDYHHVIKGQLKDFVNELSEHVGEFDGRVFVDSAPVLDKAWAAKSGIGWIGKNANLINKGSGSFFFIAELISDLEPESDGPSTDHCGTCTACIDACPTDAIVDPYVVDGSKCISYFTIELKDELPAGIGEKFDNWAFGCDICQDVCPWNRFSQPHNQPLYDPHPNLMGSLAERTELTQEVFNEVFRKSAVKRTKYAGLIRNLKAIS